MRRFLIGLAGLVALGVVVVLAFGIEAIWLYGLFAILAVATAVGIGLGGDVVRDWSRRRFDEPTHRGR
jgi:hypothetical protein